MDIAALLASVPEAQADYRRLNPEELESKVVDIHRLRAAIDQMRGDASSRSSAPHTASGASGALGASGAIGYQPEPSVAGVCDPGPASQRPATEDTDQHEHV